MTPAKAPARRQEAEDRRLWLSIFTPVVAWIAAHQTSFLLSPWICDTGRRWVLYLVIGSAFAAAAAGGVQTWTTWRTLPSSGHAKDSTLARRRFMAMAALLLTAMFLVAILALAIPAVIHRPCD